MLDLQQLLAPSQYNLAHAIEQHASEKQALIWMNERGEKRTLTYHELNQRANQLANGFTQLGLAKGDCVMVMTPRTLEAYIIYLAALKKGMIITPASELLRSKDIAYRLNHSEAKAVIVESSYTNEIQGIDEELPFLTNRICFGEEKEGWTSLSSLMETQSVVFETTRTTRDDHAFLSYTSGTTGQPKGVVHTHGWGYTHIQTAAKNWLNISSTDTVWATAGPGWQKWVWSPFLSILGSGATGFVYQGKFHPATYLRLLSEQAINVLCCTPTEYRMMAKVDSLHTYRLPHLHSAVSAGEALNKEVIDTFIHHFNLRIRDGYGQTENTLLIGTLHGGEHRIGSMGRPLMEGFVTIVDDEGIPCPVGTVGNIAVQKTFPALFALYYKEPQRTQNAFKGNYYVTGDQAYQDEDGYFWFQGRSDDIIISSGYTIGPFEVEEAIMKHESVKECAVISHPDELRGSVVKAVIVVKDGVLETDALKREIQQFVKKQTAPYKYPRIIEFRMELPKTDSGKIKRRDLRVLV